MFRTVFQDHSVWNEQERCSLLGINESWHKNAERLGGEPSLCLLAYKEVISSASSFWFGYMFWFLDDTSIYQLQLPF
ncbi:MAG: hypothetical protein WC155_09270, partial [Candidatus Cloacimonadales bacterium]